MASWAQTATALAADLMGRRRGPPVARPRSADAGADAGYFAGALARAAATMSTSPSWARGTATHRAAGRQLASHGLSPSPERRKGQLYHAAGIRTLFIDWKKR
ncbi:MAG: hypothetical protein ACRDRT_00715 [Pseudonocardiaceae bacterium]